MGLFKDKNNINKPEYQNANIKVLAQAMKKNELKKLLFGEEKVTNKPHIPTHTRCSFNMKDANAARTTEKRMCRCMYYYNNMENEKQFKVCHEKCLYAWKWQLNKESQYRITDYEVPSGYVIKGIGGVDLLIDDGRDKYAVEVKPEDSNETIIRMIAEILTYVEDEKFEKYKPAICFFKDSNQYKQFEELLSDADFKYILNEKDIAVFYFWVTKRGIINEFEIQRYEWDR